MAGCADGSVPTVEPTQAYVRSWDALAFLKTRLREHLRPGHGYSHLVVASMGWNTDQVEAVRNFNSLMKAVRKAGGDRFAAAH